MKNLICLLLFLTSFHLYADDSKILLDPLKGKKKLVGGEIVEVNSSETFLLQEYTKECSIEKVLTGYSKNCSIEIRGDNSDPRNNALEMLSTQSPYIKDCFIELHSNGRYSEFCIDPKEESPEDFSSQEETSSVDKTNHQEELIFPQWLEKTQSGVGRVIVQFREDVDTRSEGIGSGFFIKDSNKQPIFVTNYHIFGSILWLLIQMNIPDQDWFKKTSNTPFYVEQGDQKFLITGVRDLSLLMDLAVLEVENYTGSTLSLADDYLNEVPNYILGYPTKWGLQKIKATNAFSINSLYTSFMVSHNMTSCKTLIGISGSPALNQDGKIIGITSSIHPSSECRHLNVIPINNGFENFMSSLKTSKESIASLIKEQESLFYYQLLSDEENKKDLMMRAIFYLDNDMILSNFLNPVNKDDLLDTYHKLSSSNPELNEVDKNILKFLVQKNITNIQRLDIRIREAAQAGNLEAQFVVGHQFYLTRQFKEAHQLFQGLAQLRNPLYLYLLSNLYYRKENNLIQACKLLTYAKEPVAALEDLYQERECDSVLNRV